MSSSLKRTPLYDRHLGCEARFTPFAGYEMPVQFSSGVLVEHRWTREHAGLFDVSHMGPFHLHLTAPTGDAQRDHAALAAVVEKLTSADVQGLAAGRMRYGVLLNEAGGMLDDLMIARPDATGTRLYLVVNGATKEEVLPLFQAAAAGAARLVRADDGALLALQGPESEGILETLFPGVRGLAFMDVRTFEMDGREVLVSRSGYTGEDGFEVLAPPSLAVELYDALLADSRARPIGLGARDSLRLEAGLPLYGHDADASVSPVEAGLGFAVSKKRLKAGGMRGAARLARELDGELARVRCGLRILEGAPAREGAEIVTGDGARLGVVTSGGFSPTLSKPIAMGFVPPAFARPGQAVKVRVRDRLQSAEIVSLPFVPHRYVRKP